MSLTTFFYHLSPPSPRTTHPRKGGPLTPVQRVKTDSNSSAREPKYTSETDPKDPTSVCAASATGRGRDCRAACRRAKNARIVISCREELREQRIDRARREETRSAAFSAAVGENRDREVHLYRIGSMALAPSASFQLPREARRRALKPPKWGVDSHACAHIGG